MTTVKHSDGSNGPRPRPHVDVGPVPGKRIEPAAVWVYVQSTGEILYRSQLVGLGYSGFEDAKNRPERETQHDRGPIPHGVWKIGRPYADPQRGPLCIPLTPHGHEAFRRTGFLIHSDSVRRPGHASTGCIIAEDNVRQRIASSSCPNLFVMRKRPKPDEESADDQIAGLAQALGVSANAALAATRQSAAEYSLECNSLVYEQSTGRPFRSGRLIGVGYSGAENHKNDPDAQSLHDRGPIPHGKWTVSQAYAHPTKGPIAMTLTPIRHGALGRSDFMIHGDSASHPGHASNGCIVLDGRIRREVASCGVHVLEVIR